MKTKRTYINQKELKSLIYASSFIKTIIALDKTGMNETTKDHLDNLQNIYVKATE